MRGLVIFDVGGVLRDSSLVLPEGYKRGFGVFGIKFNFTPRQVWKLRGIGKYNNVVLGAKAFFGIIKSGMDIDSIIKDQNSEALIDEIVEQNVRLEDLVKIEAVGRIYREYFNSDEATDKIRLFDDARESILKLKENGYEVAIFSNGARNSIKRDVEPLGLGNFTAIMGEEDVIKKKPAGDGIIKIMYKLNYPFERTYYVGDVPTDIIAAKDAKCKSIALLTGMGAKKNLEAEKPDLIFEDLTSMTNYLVSQ
ncbi:MAG: HAD family hydrolase [Candidatus Micrarchaeota archaeon]|nr:HAD family hydrolase [Candidatus Micrarchaeota archaeon]